jgi:protein-S-isoprenylcysteine O-methyltransferase Ste14
MKALELKIPPVVFTIIIAATMWMINYLSPSLVMRLPFSYVIAALMAVLGGVVALAGVVALRKAETTVNPLTPDNASSIVAFGIYQYSRNPMYLGLLLVLLGWAVLLGSLLTFLALPVFIMYINKFQIYPEERALITRFGKKYQSYAKRVRRWL